MVDSETRRLDPSETNMNTITESDIDKKGWNKEINIYWLTVLS